MSSVISVMPDGSEAGAPSSDADDDFETDEGLTARDAEYERMAAAATAAGVPPRRSGRVGIAASTAAADASRASERAPPPTDPPGRAGDGATA